MKLFGTSLLALLLAIGMTATLRAETYDSEGGINWFSDDDSESAGAFDSGEGYEYDRDLIGDDEYEAYETGLGEENDMFEADDYGTYDSNYSWDSEDEWFDGWYSDSDEMF